MKIQLTIPTSWNDCSDSQLTKIARLLYKGVSGKVFDYRCFRILVNEKWYHLFTKAKINYILASIPMREIKPSFNFIFEENTLTRFPKISQHYFPPLPQISNLSIGELAVADDLHIKFRLTKEKEYLYYLAATLYVSQQQPRPPFDKNDLSFKVEDFKKIPLEQLLVVEQAFHGCKEYLAKKFPTVFPKPKEQPENHKQQTTNHKPKIKSSQFPKLILELSGGKFGTHQETSRTNCYTFLAEFEKLLKQK